MTKYCLPNSNLLIGFETNVLHFFTYRKYGAEIRTLKIKLSFINWFMSRENGFLSKGNPGEPLKKKITFVSQSIILSVTNIPDDMFLLFSSAKLVSTCRRETGVSLAWNFLQKLISFKSARRNYCYVNPSETEYLNRFSLIGHVFTIYIYFW